MITVITGSNGSLGTTLMGVGQFDSWNTVGINSATILSGKVAIENRIDSIINSCGPIDRVVNNFGINHLSWIGETPEEDKKIFDANVLAPYWVVNHLVARGQVCRVVNVASATYRVPQRCTALYCASKAALVQMSKVMARELAPKGWVINCIAPGLIVNTTMAKMTGDQVCELRDWSKEQADKYAAALVPMGRATSTAEVAEAIAKIFDLPSYINGTVIDMMGGV